MTIYILYSPKKDIFYIGNCEDLKVRMTLHQSHACSRKFISLANDWQIHLKIEHLGFHQAGHIEHHLRRMKSHKLMTDLARYPEMVKRLCRKYQE
ncbi:MAG: GIY-YIG nuclease family protein [Bacteroidota bacterium]